ncbi:MAG: glycosyltransferase family A protein [Chitinophagales bacterium]
MQHSLQYAVKAIENLDAEIIVVNDGDKAILIPDEWTSAVNVVKNPKSGVASARNFRAANAKSGLLIFMDDDMLIHENAVKRAMGW